MSKVEELITGIKNDLKQVSSSQKDEVAVMQAMLNSPDYEVGVYGKEGKIGTYNPCEDFRGMLKNIVAGATTITKGEAEEHIEKYIVTKSDAETMVNVSKEYMNTYLGTGRKIKLGGRETSDYGMSIKHVPQSTKSYPIKNADGSTTFGKKDVPAHDSIKVYGSCPSWVK